MFAMGRKKNNSADKKNSSQQGREAGATPNCKMHEILRHQSVPKDVKEAP